MQARNDEPLIPGIGQGMAYGIATVRVNQMHVDHRLDTRRSRKPVAAHSGRLQRGACQRREEDLHDTPRLVGLKLPSLAN